MLEKYNASQTIIYCIQVGLNKMPLYKTHTIDKQTTIYLWKIAEDFDALFSEVQLNEKSLHRLQEMKSESHKKGFLAVRMLLQHLGYSDFHLYYDSFGKPHLKDGKEISISHSFHFSAIAISTNPIGIDIEQIKPKILRIAPRYLDVLHLENLSEEKQLQKATLIWGIKECIFKIKNEKGISFPNHIFEEDFNIEDKKTTALLHFNEKKEYFTVAFDTFEDYVWVCAWQS